MNPFHLFTLGGIPVFVSPFYLLLLFFLARGEPLRAVILAIGITLSLLVHEFGHALVARHLRHNPTILLHGMGGLTSRTQTGRDVEEAAIVAMGPAAGLALGLAVYGVWRALLHLELATPLGAEVAYAFLWPCITWNLLNLLPMWPLDGGQLVRLGAGYWLGRRSAQRLTHGVSLAVIGALLLFVLRAGGGLFALLILGLLAFQNVGALRGQASGSAAAPSGNGLVNELIVRAQQAAREGQLKEAVRLAHQARAQDGVSAAQLDAIWEILGVANTELGECEEALSYLRRAQPSDAVREATSRCLKELGRDPELGEIHSRWQHAGRGKYMGGWLVGALSFIALAVCAVFATSLSRFFF